jgi:hypothetical protein
MNQRSRYWYSWVVAQLVGIRTLEAQLSEALAAGGRRKTSDVRRRMVELQLRCDLLDRALNGPALDLR